MRINGSSIKGFLTAALLVACADPGEEVGQVQRPTTAVGARGTILANSSLGEAETHVKWEGKHAKVKDATTLVMQEIVLDPGGHTGWHTHGGMAFVSIVEGALWLYEGEFPCVGTAYPAGTAFVDPGAGHVHIARNLGTAPALVRVQYVLPTGAAIRIDAPEPEGASACP